MPEILLEKESRLIRHLILEILSFNRSFVFWNQNSCYIVYNYLLEVSYLQYSPDKTIFKLPLHFKYFYWDILFISSSLINNILSLIQLNTAGSPQKASILVLFFWGELPSTKLVLFLLRGAPLNKIRLVCKLFEGSSPQQMKTRM